MFTIQVTNGFLYRESFVISEEKENIMKLLSEFNDINFNANYRELELYFNHDCIVHGDYKDIVASNNNYAMIKICDDLGIPYFVEKLGVSGMNTDQISWYVDQLTVEQLEYLNNIFNGMENYLVINEDYASENEENLICDQIDYIIQDLLRDIQNNYDDDLEDFFNSEENYEFINELIRNNYHWINTHIEIPFRDSVLEKIKEYIKENI